VDRKLAALIRKPYLEKHDLKVHAQYTNVPQSFWAKFKECIQEASMSQVGTGKWGEVRIIARKKTDQRRIEKNKMRREEGSSLQGDGSKKKGTKNAPVGNSLDAASQESVVKEPP